MDDKERRQLENQLLTIGLAGLTDSELIQELANMVSNWPGDKHQFLEDLLNQCDLDKRWQMYDAITPKLRFKALPLSTYEARIALRASELISQRKMRVEGQTPRPIEIQGRKFEKVPRALATNAVATVKCYRCKRMASYLGDTPAGAMIAARKDGWTRDKAVNKEVCKACN